MVAERAVFAAKMTCSGEDGNDAARAPNSSANPDPYGDRSTLGSSA